MSHRIRRRWSRRDRRFAASAVAAGIGMAALSGHHAGTGGAHATAASVIRGSIPGGSGYTPSSWAAALLSAGGWPPTGCNLGAITAWEAAEGGNWENSAARNPLDTTMPESGSWPVNSVNVQAYPSWQEGYGGILSALSAGESAQAVADAVAASPWGTGSFNATC